MGNLCSKKYKNSSEIPIISEHRRENGTKKNNNCSNDLQKSHDNICHPKTNKAHTKLRNRNRIVIAKVKYEAEATMETYISFQEGDRMEVLNDSRHNWWRVINLRTRQEGLIIPKFVSVELGFENEEWYFDCLSRIQVNNLLLSNRNRRTFIVRPSEQTPNAYCLSIKRKQKAGEFRLNHYKIKPHDKGGFYIRKEKPFSSLRDLVLYYTENTQRLYSRTCDLVSDHQDIWELSRKEIKLNRKLGEGNFGEVYYGKWRNNIEVAVKTLKNGTMVKKQAFFREAAIMKKCRHKNLIGLYAVCSHEEPICIILEYMSKGSLRNFLHSEDGRHLQFKDLVYIAAQIASGMEYLASKQVIHRDLAARNILIGEENEAKICDFGLAIETKDIENCLTEDVPFRWTAPEALFNRRFSIKSDVWSYGILLMELFTYGQMPYAGMTKEEIIKAIKSGYRLPNPSGKYRLPADIYNIILKCWNSVSEKRPTFEFLQDFFDNWSEPL